MRIIPINNYKGYSKYLKYNQREEKNNKENNNMSNSLQYDRNIVFRGLYSSTNENEVIKAENALLRQPPTSLGVGFYGPKTVTKDTLFENFINDMSNGGYNIVRIPTLQEAAPDEIAVSINGALKDAEAKYKETGTRSLLVVRDLDEISKNNKVMRNLMSMENSTNKGFAWVWDAKDKNSIDKTLIRRTSDYILVRPSINDGKEVWDSYISMISSMPESDKRANLLNDAVSVKPVVFPFNIQNIHQNKIESLKFQFEVPILSDTEENETLSSYQQQTEMSILGLSDSERIKEIIGTAKIGDEPLIDFWLTQSGENPNDYTSRLKEAWLEETLMDEEQTSKLIDSTLQKLEAENALIKTARKSYTDILENEAELKESQKDILRKQQDSKLFFLVISNTLQPRDKIKLQLNVIKTIRQLSADKEAVIKNAQNAVFDNVKDIDVLKSEDADDIENVTFVFDLLSDKISNSSQQEKDELNAQITSFERAKEEGKNSDVQTLWSGLVQTAQDYFENTKVDEITDRNIQMLYSIQKNSSDNDPKVVQDFLKSDSNSIEQKDFVSRYKNDKNLLLILNNPNVNKKNVIDELLYMETFNNKIMADLLAADSTIKSEQDLNEQFENWQNSELKPYISSKMLEFNQEYDINYQGKEIKSRLDTITQTIGVQTDAINDFANKFADYASSSLTLQTAQLNQMVRMADILTSIDANTRNAAVYTQALTRAKLAELEKDKYYKDIVPEITKLLPPDEQIDLKDFLSKVDQLVKKEKNVTRKKKIIKAAVIVATVASVGAITYFAGPAIVAHLASGVTTAGTAVGSTAKASAAVAAGMQTANIGKKLGQNGLINFLGRSAKQISAEIKRVESELEFLKNQLRKYPKDTHYASRYDDLQYALKKLYKELEKATA